MIYQCRRNIWIHLETESFGLGVFPTMLLSRVDATDRSDMSERCRHNFAGLGAPTDNFCIRFFGDFVIFDIGTKMPWLAVVNIINILQAPLAPIFFCQKSQSQTVIREKLHKALLCEKVLRKILMKLTPGHSKYFLSPTLPSFLPTAVSCKSKKNF